MAEAAASSGAERVRSAVLVALMALLLGPVAGAQEPSPPPPVVDLKALPRLWSVVSRRAATDEQRLEMARRLEVPALTFVENALIDAGGVQLKVNLLAAPDEAAAIVVQRQVEALFRKPPGTVFRRGATVIELVGRNGPILARVAHALGLAPAATVRWKVAAVVSPLLGIEDPEPTAWNRLFNHLGALGAGGDPSAARDLAKGFRFAPALRAAPAGAPGLLATPLEPSPHLPDVPRLRLEGDVEVTAFTARPAPAPGEALTAATPRWPTDLEPLREAVDRLDVGQTGQARLEALLGLVRGALRYGGETGCRQGVAAALERKVGQCADHADLLVALCRTAGIPARGVWGWVAGLGGHVWVEAWLPDRRSAGSAPDGAGGAWHAVDATATWVGVSADYVPIFVTEDGEVPAVYWGPPRLDRGEPK